MKNPLSIIRLPLVFVNRDDHYTQLMRQDKLAIYIVTTDHAQHYEVAIIQTLVSNRNITSPVPGIEWYPDQEEKNIWAFDSIKEAEEKFNSLKCHDLK